MSDPTQIISAINQFRLEIARAAQYAAMIDAETNSRFSVADDLVSIGEKLGKLSDELAAELEAKTQQLADVGA
jgi:uncharacterized membrane protein